MLEERCIGAIKPGLKMLNYVVLALLVQHLVASGVLALFFAEPKPP